MPIRLIDYPGLYNSDTLELMPRIQDRTDYVWFYGIAEANGVFEANPKAIWQATCARLRPDHTPETVAAWLDEAERVKAMFRWEQDGKILGFWTKSDKPGRRPPPSKQGKLHYPDPPKELLEKFLRRKVRDAQRALFRKPLGTHRVPRAKPEGTGPVRDGRPGLVRSGLDRKGFGLGERPPSVDGKPVREVTSSPASSSLSPSSSSSLRSSSSSGSASSSAGEERKKNSGAVDEKKHPRFANELKKKRD